MSGTIVPHPAFTAARAALDRALAAATPGQLIFVVGLSGAGKSELRYDAMRRYAGLPAQWGIGRIPAISVRATPSDKSYFSPKDFIGRLLMEIHEPNIDWLKSRDDVAHADIVQLQREIVVAGECWKVIRSKRVEHAMRLEFERSARARSLQAIFIDEAGSITYSTRGKHPGEHMVSYMCMAEEIPVVMVLFGVPRVQALWSGNAEIRRRSHFVYVHRYNRQRSGDVENFARLAVTLSQRYQFESADLVRENLDTAYYATAGVFGEAKEYYARADELRAVEGRPAISAVDLEQAVYPARELKTLHEEAGIFDEMVTPADLSRTRNNRRQSNGRV